MPGFFDFLGGLFGGGSGGGGGIDASGGIDWSQTTPFDATTVAGGFSPADIFTSVPGLTDTSSLLGGVGDMLGGMGGSGGSPLSSLLTSPVVRSVLGGGSSGGSTPTAQPRPQTNVPQAPQSNGGQGGSGGISGLLGDVLSKPALLAMFPQILGAINAKDATNLGPDAQAMRDLATKNQSTITSLQGEAAAEKMGELPGPAMQTIARNLQEQRASLATSYSRMGMSGSSAEAADMAALNQKAESDRFNIGLGMANEGLSQVSSLTGQDVSIYGQLMTAQTERDKEYMDAMARVMDGLGKAMTAPGQSGGGAGGAPGTANPAVTETRGTGDGIAPPTAGLSNPPGGSALISQLLAGITPMITPQTNVPDLVPTGTGLPDPSTLDTTPWNPDQIAASDFLSGFVGLGA